MLNDETSPSLNKIDKHLDNDATHWATLSALFSAQKGPIQPQPSGRPIQRIHIAQCLETRGPYINNDK